MKRNDPASLTAGKAFLWMVVAFGAWLIWSGMGEAGKNPRAHWKAVEGEVIGTSMQKAWSDSSGQRLVGPVGFDVSIRYVYAVNGAAYEGVWTYYDPGLDPVPSHRAGERVAVYYPPDAPRESSLSDGYDLVVTRDMQKARVFSGAACLLSGLFFLVLLRLKAAKSA